MARRKRKLVQGLLGMPKDRRCPGTIGAVEGWSVRDDEDPTEKGRGQKMQPALERECVNGKAFRSEPCLESFLISIRSEHHSVLCTDRWNAP